MKTFKTPTDLMEFFRSEGFGHNFLKDMFWDKKVQYAYCGSENNYPSEKELRHCCKFEFENLWQIIITFFLASDVAFLSLAIDLC